MKRYRYSVRKRGQRWEVYRDDFALVGSMDFATVIRRAQELAAKDRAAAVWDREHREWASAERRASRIAQDYLRHARGEL